MEILQIGPTLSAPDASQSLGAYLLTYTPQNKTIKWESFIIWIVYDLNVL